MTEADGGPLSAVVAAVNVNDMELLEAMIEAIVVERQEPTEQQPQNLCLDKAFDNPMDWKVTQEHDYVPHIRRIGEEKRDESKRKGHPARRWVVERTLAWLSKCRAILVRYAKYSWVYLGLIQVACFLLWY